MMKMLVTVNEQHPCITLRMQLVEWGDTMSYLPFQYAYIGSFEIIEETLAMVQCLKLTLEHFGQFW
jgi:hypothetical protein